MDFATILWYLKKINSFKRQPYKIVKQTQTIRAAPRIVWVCLLTILRVWRLKVFVSFLLNFEYISNLVLVFLLLTLSR